MFYIFLKSFTAKIKKRGILCGGDYFYFWPMASFVVYVWSLTHKFEAKTKCFYKWEYFISKKIFGKNEKRGNLYYFYFCARASFVVYVWSLTHKFEAKRRCLYKWAYIISSKIFGKNEKKQEIFKGGGGITSIFVSEQDLLLFNHTYWVLNSRNLPLVGS